MSEVLKILNLELLLDRLLFYLRILINFLGELEELRGGNTCFLDPCFICNGGKSALGFVGDVRQPTARLVLDLLLPTL